MYKKLDRSRQGVKVNGGHYITSRKEGNGKEVRVEMGCTLPSPLPIDSKMVKMIKTFCKLLSHCMAPLCRARYNY